LANQIISKKRTYS